MIIYYMSSLNVSIYKYLFINKVLIDQSKMYYLLYLASLFDPGWTSDPQPSLYLCLIASLYFWIFRSHD